MASNANIFMLSLCILLNICFSVVIVLLNKFIYTHFSFPNITLTCLHFIFTTVGVSVCYRSGIFQRKCLPVAPMLWLSISFCGFVTFTNLSLQYNTVSTYQLAKTLTTPTVILLQIKYQGKKFSNRILTTLVPIIAGVCLNSYSDVKFSWIGTVLALTAVLVTSVYQVLVSHEQQKMQMNSLQLLYYQAPLSATVLMPFIVVFEPLFGDQGILSTWSYEALIMVAVSGVIAFGVNLTIFWMIGNTSPLTYNVVGHTKFCLTLLGGLFLFKDGIHPVQAAGMILTIIGAILYTIINLQESGHRSSTQIEEKRKNERKHLTISIE